MTIRTRYLAIGLLILVAPTPRSDGIARQVEDLLRRGRTQQGVIHFYRFMLDPNVDHDVVEEMTASGDVLRVSLPNLMYSRVGALC